MNLSRYSKAIASAVIGLAILLLPSLGINLDPQVRAAIQTLLGTAAVYFATNKPA